MNRLSRKDCPGIWESNDTIYDIWGITTSGLLEPADALRILSVGPEYTQTVLKTEKAAARLRFVSARRIPEAEISRSRETVRREEDAYQAAVSEYIRDMTETSGE